MTCFMCPQLPVPGQDSTFDRCFTRCIALAECRWGQQPQAQENVVPPTQAPESCVSLDDFTCPWVKNFLPHAPRTVVPGIIQAMNH